MSGQSSTVSVSIFNPCQPGVAFHMETSHLLCREKQMTRFYMKHNTGLKWVKHTILLQSISNTTASLMRLTFAKLTEDGVTA